jgi:dienelactone hydrolase
MIAPGLKRIGSWPLFVLGTVCFLTLTAQPGVAQQLQSPQRGGRGAGFGAGMIKARVTPHWFHDNTQFWYSNTLRDGAHEFILVDATTGSRTPAFDHARLAMALNKALDKETHADHLPFDAIEFVDDGHAVQFTIDNKKWQCDLSNYEVTAVPGAASIDVNAGASNDAVETDKLSALAASENGNDSPSDAASDFDGPGGEVYQSPQAQTQDAQAGGQRGRGRSGGGGGRGGFGRATQAASPDGKWTALVRDNNLVLRDANSNDTDLTKDGRSDLAYTGLNWSPDSKYLVAFRMEPGDRKEVYRVQSSPAGTGDAKGGGVGRAVLQTGPYALPGDKLDSYELNVFNLETKQQFKPLGEERIDMNPDGGDPNPTFGGPNPNMRWRRDGTHFTVEKFDRGHQRARIIEVNAPTGETRNILDEKTDTFIWSAHIEELNLRLINYLRNENEIIYVSEMDGWRHFYLIDIPTGKMKQITKGQWVVRGVNRIDDDARQIWFAASGVYPDQDPYLVQYGRVNFDGTGLTWLTSGNGNHTITFGGEAAPQRGAGGGRGQRVQAAPPQSSFSPDSKYVIDSYSRVDLPPITELRRVSDGQIVCALEKAEVTTPFEPPEVFVAKGRDGTTDIWGLIYRPRNLDTSKKYPILEDIYSGPQGAFVPKSFRPGNQYQELNNLGFIVVKIDGMGTANRSKAFHDVCWKNLKDGGFLDRIAWIKDAAKKYPYMDLDRVGIYGTSAGGQNAAAAVLFHPEFYKVAVANSGCHDNRMDKVSWNEQWMGYPIGPQYSECSNIDNAGKLQGHLQLVVGELDTNVPPESTYRFVNALVQDGKDFEFVMIPGANHGAGSPITRTKLQDFFIRYLKGVEPPNHNAPRGAE